MVFGSIKKVKEVLDKNPDGVILEDIQTQTGISKSQVYEILGTMLINPACIKIIRRHGKTFYLPKHED